MTERAAARSWFALRVRSNQEFKVERALFLNGFEPYVPVYVVEARWSDRTKRTVRPLLPGYVFARFLLEEAATVLQFAGVVHILGSNLLPTPIDPREIERVRLLAESSRNPSPCAYVAGQEIEIHQGPLAGLRGVVVRTRGETRLVVQVEMLGRAVSVAVDAECLQVAA